MPKTPHSSCMVSPSRTRSKSSAVTDTLQSSGPPSKGFVKGKGDEVANVDVAAACSSESDRGNSRPLARRLDICVVPIRGGYDYPRRSFGKQRVPARCVEPGAGGVE